MFLQIQMLISFSKWQKNRVILTMVSITNSAIMHVYLCQINSKVTVFIFLNGTSNFGVVATFTVLRLWVPVFHLLPSGATYFFLFRHWPVSSTLIIYVCSIRLFLFMAAPKKFCFPKEIFQVTDVLHRQSFHLHSPTHSFSLVLTNKTFIVNWDGIKRCTWLRFVSAFVASPLQFFSHPRFKHRFWIFLNCPIFKKVKRQFIVNVSFHGFWTLILHVTLYPQKGEDFFPATIFSLIFSLTLLLFLGRSSLPPNIFLSIGHFKEVSIVFIFLMWCILLKKMHDSVMSIHALLARQSKYLNTFLPIFPFFWFSLPSFLPICFPLFLTPFPFQFFFELIPFFSGGGGERGESRDFVSVFWSFHLPKNYQIRSKFIVRRKIDLIRINSIVFVEDSVIQTFSNL